MHYPSMHTLRTFRIKYGFNDFHQIHHIIPKSCKRYVYDPNKLGIDSGKNLMFMPTKKGIERFHLDENTLVHQGPHPAYNNFIKQELKSINNEKLFYDFLLFLRTTLNLRNNYKKIYWK